MAISNGKTALSLCYNGLLTIQIKENGKNCLFAFNNNPYKNIDNLANVMPSTLFQMEILYI